MNGEDTVNQKLIDNSDAGSPRVYLSRWYVLTLVCVANVLNNAFWATWGPISRSTELVYSWTDNTLFWVVNVGNISGFVFTLLGCYLVDRRGIRVATVTCMALMTVTAASRVITTSQPGATILISIGQFFNGIATSVTMTLPPAVAEVWFPVSERTRATAISAMSAAMGAAAAFLFGPLFVSMPVMNDTTVLLNETDVGRISKELKTYNYINFGVSVLAFVCVLVYLPGKPPTAPSLSARVPRYQFWEGVKKLIRNRDMWVIGVTYAIVNGFNGNFGSMLDVILTPHGISQTEAGLMSFYASLGGILLALITSRIVDKFKHHMKTVIMINYLIGGILIFWFSFMVQGTIPSTKVGLYVAVILSSTMISACMPLFIEITCETSYPIGEGVTAGFLGMGVNLGASLVLAFSQIKGLGASWMSWSVSGALVAALPLLAVLKIRYQKVDLDTGQVTGINVRCDT